MSLCITEDHLLVIWVKVLKSVTEIILSNISTFSIHFFVNSDSKYDMIVMQPSEFHDFHNGKKIIVSNCIKCA